MTILLPLSSQSFQVTPEGALTQDIYLGDNFSFPKNETELTKIYMDKIIARLALALARDLPGFLWKNENEASQALIKMEVEKKNYSALIWKYKRTKNKQGGGLMEFEILTNPENEIGGYRITKELIID